jgi:enoyl-CoA hydratase
MLILRERVLEVEVLTLNRPEAANSLNPRLMDELGIALQDVLDDDSVRAVIITGAGERVFCAGMDLGAVGDWNDSTAESALRPGAVALDQFMDGTFPKPLIAAVNGAAVGGGLEIMMACDLAIAVEHARFGLPEVKRGLFAAGGGTLLPLRIPQALALEMGLTGRLIGADQAMAAGLVNRVVPATELWVAANALAAEIAANGPLGVQLTKQLMRDAVASGSKAGRATPEQSRRIFQSEDAREGAEAFMEKRVARFQGR